MGPGQSHRRSRRERLLSRPGRAPGDGQSPARTPPAPRPTRSARCFSSATPGPLRPRPRSRFDRCRARPPRGEFHDGWVCDSRRSALEQIGRGDAELTAYVVPSSSAESARAALRPGQPGRTAGACCMRPRTHSHGCGRQPVGAVVKFWSSCGGKAWQLVAKRSRVEPARLRPAATTDDSRRRLSPLSHPGRLRFELGWLHPVSSRSRAEPDHREQRDHERPHACVLVATTTDPSACATERGRRYVRRGRMDYD